MIRDNPKIVFFIMLAINETKMIKFYPNQTHTKCDKAAILNSSPELSNSDLSD